MKHLVSIYNYAKVMKLKQSFRKVLGPKLGVLHQYPPRPVDKMAYKSFSAALPAEIAPRISLVTPSFGQGQFIGDTLQSVFNQGYANLEYFVEDGGSQDNTAEVVKLYEDKLAGWVSEKDSGQSHAINKGFQRATGDLMGWLNSDDLLLPNTLNTVAKYFVDHPKVDVVYGNRVMIDENGLEIGRWILPGHSDAVLSWADYIPQETLFWRKSIWKRSGGCIDQSFSFAMDWDLLVRFRDAGARFAHIPKFLGAFRVHQQQKTSAVISELGLQEMNKIRQRVHGYIPSQQHVQKAVAPFLLKHMYCDFKWRVSRDIRFWN